MANNLALDKFLNKDGAEVQVCGSCNFFLPGDKDPSFGLCRRFPPQLMAEKQKGEAFNAFPTMRNFGWCGEWKANNPDKMVL